MKKEKPKAVTVSPKISGITKRGLRVILTGIIVLAAGYFILTKADPSGQNWASNLSPFLILGGYTIIGAGILIPEKPSSQTTAHKT